MLRQFEKFEKGSAIDRESDTLFELQMQFTELHSTSESEV